MRWNDAKSGLVDLKITGIEENLFFRSLNIYPPTTITPSLTVSMGMFQLYSTEDLEEFSKLFSSSEVTWKRDNSMLVVKNFYTIHDVKALNHFKDKFIEYKKPTNNHNIIIRTYDNKGKFMFKVTLFNIYGISLDTTSNKVSFKYKQELKEFDE